MFVEGNTDALMAHQQGFENVVGTLGTALTAAQIELVTRYAPRIAMAYDVDAAGQGAATFGATELSALVGEIERSAHKGRLTDVGVVRLPDGRDPDEVMRDDPGLWRQAADNPQPIVEYLIDNFAKRHDPRTLAGREKLVAAVMPTIRRVTNPTQRDGYLQLLARRSGVEERVLLEELKRPDEVARGVGRPEAHVGAKINLEAVLSSPDALDPESVGQLIRRAEFSMLRLLLLRPYLRDELARPWRGRGHRVREHPGARNLVAPRQSAHRGLRSAGIRRLAGRDPRRRRAHDVRRPRATARRRGCAAPGTRPEPADAAAQPHRRRNRGQGIRHPRSGGIGRPTNGGSPAARSQRPEATASRSRSAPQRNQQFSVRKDQPQHRLRPEQQEALPKWT